MVSDSEDQGNNVKNIADLEWSWWHLKKILFSKQTKVPWSTISDTKQAILHSCSRTAIIKACHSNRLSSTECVRAWPSEVVELKRRIDTMNMCPIFTAPDHSPLFLDRIINHNIYRDYEHWDYIVENSYCLNNDFFITFSNLYPLISKREYSKLSLRFSQI